ncbi:MAG TPA: ribbon-helix-helix domain-containing protein [Bradyrhizobium sp.]|jgi:predicted DNA-binding ribbon-helix-helix protein
MKIGGTSAIVKRSVVIRGHKTSISLEEPFWSQVRAIADAQGVTMSNLLRGIDDDREDANLSSAIRVFVLQHVRERIKPGNGTSSAAGHPAPDV